MRAVQAVRGIIWWSVSSFTTRFAIADYNIIKAPITPVPQHIAPLLPQVNLAPAREDMIRDHLRDIMDTLQENSPYFTFSSSFGEILRLVDGNQIRNPELDSPEYLFQAELWYVLEKYWGPSCYKRRMKCSKSEFWDACYDVEFVSCRRCFQFHQNQAERSNS